MASEEEKVAEIVNWHRQFGDPHGPTYIPPAMIDEGMALIDMLRRRVPDEEKLTEVLRVLGFHPPSFIGYAEDHAKQYVVEAHGHAAAWLDGLNCGAAIYALFAGSETL